MRVDLNFMVVIGQPRRNPDGSLPWYCGGGLLVLLVNLSVFPPEGNCRPHKEEVPEDRGYLAYPVKFMQRSTAEALSFDPATDPPATIRYKLTKTGRVRLRAVWRAERALVLRTLLDWTEQGFAVHEVTWDGRDASGNIVDNRGCYITFEEDSRLHGKHPKDSCREIELTAPGRMRSEAGQSFDDVRFEVASGGLDPPDGYRVRVYVDYEEVASCSLPAGERSFGLPDLPGLGAGSHLITINVDDGHDHVGVAGFRIER